MSHEGQLYTNIQNSIRLCATLTQMDYTHPKVEQIQNNPGFPVSPEAREDDRRLDSFVLMTSAFQKCLVYLMEARKELLLLGVQNEFLETKQEAQPYEKEIQAVNSTIRQQL